MPNQKLIALLQQHSIPYKLINHPSAFTAQEVAGTAHVPGKEMAKSVIVKIDGNLTMVVLPASTLVDFALLKKATGGQTLELASEEEFCRQFPDCEVGAMPPFGNLFGMDVWVAKSLSKDEEIAFPAGTHRELIRLAFKDYKKLVRPRIRSFSRNRQ
ncbi:YbaK/EbsC family protein [candidate division KSB1 bacterium]|nr:YbaK/EbsC family protein [candidate division KSB1 bacterium]